MNKEIILSALLSTTILFSQSIGTKKVIIPENVKKVSTETCTEMFIYDLNNIFKNISKENKYNVSLAKYRIYDYLLEKDLEHGKRIISNRDVDNFLSMLSSYKFKSFCQKGETVRLLSEDKVKLDEEKEKYVKKVIELTPYSMFKNKIIVAKYRKKYNEKVKPIELKKFVENKVRTILKDMDVKEIKSLLNFLERNENGRKIFNHAILRTI